MTFRQIGLDVERPPGVEDGFRPLFPADGFLRDVNEVFVMGQHDDLRAFG